VGRQWIDRIHWVRQNEDADDSTEPRQKAANRGPSGSGKAAFMFESRWLECKRPAPMLRYVAERASRRKRLLFVAACCRRLWPWLRGDASRRAVEELERQADASRPRSPSQAVRALARSAVSAAEERRQGANAVHQEADARRAGVWGSIWVGDPPAPSVLVRAAAEVQEALAHQQEAEAGVQASELVAAVMEEWDNLELVARQTTQVVVHGRIAALTRVRALRWLHRADEEADRPVPRSRAALRAAQVVQWIEQQEETIRERAERQEERTAKVERRAQVALIRDLFGNPFRPVAIEPACLEWNEGCLVKMARTIYDERKYQDMTILADALEEAGCGTAELLNHCRQPGEHARGCWALDLLLGLPV